MTDDSQNPLAECDRCGHIDYHHRPECTHRSSIISMGGNCDCPEFVGASE